MATTTLYANDSINLTTGVVTRSTTDTRGDAMLRRREANRVWFLAHSRERAARNDLNALAYVMRNGA